MSALAYDEDKVASIITQAGSGTEALRQLLSWHRIRNPRISLMRLARKLGLSSPGSVSDLLNGRRAFAPRHWEPLMSVLDLGETERACLTRMLELERATCEDRREEIGRSLALVRKQLIVKKNLFSSQVYERLFTLKVHSAFGLFGNRVGWRELLGFFGRERIVDLGLALQTLVQEKIVTCQDGVYVLDESARFLVFNDLEHKDAIATALGSSLDEARKALGPWLGQPELACFKTIMLTVDKAAFVRHLGAFRSTLDQQCQSMEATPGDALVRINVQIYPEHTR